MPYCARPWDSMDAIMVPGALYFSRVKCAPRKLCRPSAPVSRCNDSHDCPYLAASLRASTGVALQLYTRIGPQFSRPCYSTRQKKLTSLGHETLAPSDEYKSDIPKECCIHLSHNIFFPDYKCVVRSRLVAHIDYRQHCFLWKKKCGQAWTGEHMKRKFCLTTILERVIKT